ncbi:uncharacterized protein BO66DRAFT_470214 [Aspergillus aculeatinus CBS 121060]|uniref:Uncharacterized protein n=1 Tax=Aspergillus aculeatinus CBS 121060 TaxID=1448322 RepID=A0ACD1HEB3_9EURO|nr:hypothetical protein BO66DRAFT_470214 [Aspergillus aculeatinus CBS 121060]RAH71774.1 hypothetical protein BO66DRAFT_470214 [Aspergillus aculeatinus CBS 121060]
MPSTSFPLLPTISLLLSLIFCLYRLQGPIRTYRRRLRARYSGRDGYARLAAVEDGSSPSPTADQPPSSDPHNAHTENPSTPLSKYFDPQTALLYADVFERRTRPSTSWEREEGELGRQRVVGDGEGEGDGDSDAGVGDGVLGEWFGRLVEGVVRYYVGLVWEKGFVE